MNCNNSNFIIIYNIYIIYYNNTIVEGRGVLHIKKAYCCIVAMLQCCKTFRSPLTNSYL